MKAELKVNNKVIEVELTVEQLEALGIEEPKKTGWERAEKGLEFYYMHVGLGICEDKECGYQADNEREKCGNYFTDEKLAKKMAKRVSLMLRMQRWADEHNEKPIDFSNKHQQKYFIVFNGSEIRSTFTYYVSVNDVYFTSEKIVKQAIEIFGDEIKEVMSLY